MLEGGIRGGAVGGVACQPSCQLNFRPIRRVGAAYAARTGSSDLTMGRSVSVGPLAIAASMMPVVVVEIFESVGATRTFSMLPVRAPQTQRRGVQDGPAGCWIWRSRFVKQNDKQTLALTRDCKHELPTEPSAIFSRHVGSPSRAGIYEVVRRVARRRRWDLAAPAQQRSGWSDGARTSIHEEPNRQCSDRSTAGGGGGQGRSWR